MCNLDRSFKTSWLCMRVLFWDISPLYLFWAQIRWKEDGALNLCKTRGSGLAVLHWAALFLSCLCQQSRPHWASREFQGSEEHIAHSRIYCWCSALAGVTVSSTQPSTQLMHTVFHSHPPIYSAWYSVQHATHSQRIKRKTVQACIGGTEKGTNKTRAVTTCQIFCHTLYKH